MKIIEKQVRVVSEKTGEEYIFNALVKVKKHDYLDVDSTNDEVSVAALIIDGEQVRPQGLDACFIHPKTGETLKVN